MSDILKRTVFYDAGKDGVIRWHDWALVIHEGLGEMMEPYLERVSLTRNCLGGFLNFDATEPMCRVDEMKMFSLDKGLQLYGDTVTGGRLLPRTGR